MTTNTVKHTPDTRGELPYICDACIYGGGTCRCDPSPRERAAKQFAAWLNAGPKLAKAAGCYVGIKVTPAPQEKG